MTPVTSHSLVDNGVLITCIIFSVMKRIMFWIIFSSLVTLFSLYLPSILGFNLFVKNENLLRSSINLTESIKSLLCSVSLLLVPLVENIADFSPDDRKRDYFDVAFKLIRVLCTLCPQLAMLLAAKSISLASLFPAIFGSQQIILLMVFTLTYLEHGKSFLSPNLIAVSFGMGLIPIVSHCYSAYFLSNFLGTVSLWILGITTLGFTVLLLRFFLYIFNNYANSSKNLSKSDYICGLHMCGQWFYAFFYFILFLLKNGMLWQDATVFQLCAKVYVLAAMNALVSVFYDRLLRRDLSWTKVLVLFLIIFFSREHRKLSFIAHRKLWKANGHLSVTFHMKCEPHSAPHVWGWNCFRMPTC